MFKFDPDQVLTHQKLGGTHKSSVYPYLEGREGKKWVVKCIKVDDLEEVNSVQQNLQITSAVNCPGIIPIRGYELQKDGQGYMMINVRMPRMHMSLKEIMQFGLDSNQTATAISLEQIVNYFHSIVSTLDELSQKEVAHRNLKPSNIFIDHDGLVYLSDIKMTQSSEGNMKDNREIRSENGDDDILFRAPETFDDNWMTSQANLYKADSWSVGMVIAKACLLDSLIPPLLDLPIEENKHIIEQNIALIANRFGKYFAEIVKGLLALNPNERENFSGTRRLLEETFPKFLVSWDKHIIKDPFDKHDLFDKQSPQILEIKEETLGLVGLNISRSESNILSDNISSIKKYSTIDHGGSFQSWMARSRKFFRFRRPEWLNRQSFLQGLRKGKELAWAHKRLFVAMLIFIVLLLFVLKITILKDLANQEKFTDTMEGLQLKHGKFFRINFHNQGTLDAETIYYENNKPNDERMASLINDVIMELEEADLVDHFKVFKLRFSPNSRITDATLVKLQTDLLRMKNLRGVIIDQINGPTITKNAIQSLFNTLSGELKYLEELGVGLFGNVDMSPADRHNLVTNIFHTAKNLNGFYFLLNNISPSDDELQQLAYDISENGQNLKTLGIRIRGCPNRHSVNPVQPYANATGLKNFNSILLSNLNNLEDLDLNFNESPTMTDETIDVIVKGLTSHSKKLRKFRLAMDLCNFVTEDGINYLGHQLSSKKFKNLDYVLIHVPSGFPWSPHYIPPEERVWLRDKLKSIPEVHILPDP